MKEYLNQFGRFTAIFIVAVVLQACGGSSDKSEKYTISANATSIAFSNEFLQVSDNSYQVDVTFNGDGLLVGFAPDSQPVGWLNFRTENVTATSATLFIDVVNAENIIADTYNTKLRLSTGNVDKPNLVHHDINVSLLIWQLITDQNAISFRATLGETAIASQSLSLTSESNQWTAQSDASWLTLDTTEGTGDAIINLTANPAQFTTAGLYPANITLTEVTSGDTKVIPVELGLDSHYLFSDQSAISFSRLANIDATSTTVSINTNSPTPYLWQASSDFNWLTLTPDANNNKLTVSIAENSEFTMAQNMATITINAIDSEGNIIETVQPETVNVAFYQSNEASENQVIADIVINENGLTHSPYLPHIYVATTHQLKVYHQYSGELLSTLDVAPEASLLENLIIHPDGQLLLAQADEIVTNEDESTTTVTHRYQINLLDNTVIALSDATIDYDPVRFISNAGRHFIITQAMEVADSALQRQFWDQANAFSTIHIDQAKNSQAIYALDFNDYSIKRYTAQVNDFTTESIRLTQTHQYRPELLGESDTIRDFIVDDNEQGIYAISPTSEWISFNGETFTDNGLLAQTENNTSLSLTKSTNGRAHFLRYTQTTGFYLDIYNQQQQLINTVSTLGQQPRELVLAPDNKRLIVNAANASQLELINIEQIATSTHQLSFSSTFGNNSIDAQQFTVSGLSSDWLIETNNDWLLITTDETDGIITVTANIDPSKITTWGLLTGSITIVDSASGQTRVINVELAIDEVRLFGHAPAITFNQQFDKSVLSQIVSVLTNSATAINWQASTTVDWLTLTPDTINNTLTISADPSKITGNGIFYADISLSPQVANSALNGVIKVSLTKGNFDTSDFSEVKIENVIPNDAATVLDPLRPYIYVAQGDAIKVYHVIDGSEVATIASPLADVNLTNLVIHPDGSMLLASNVESYLDDNEQEQTRTNYYQLDLTSHSFSQLDSTLVDIEYSPAKIIMVSGKAIVVTEALELADLSLTRQYWNNEAAFVSAAMSYVASSNTLIAYDGSNTNLQHNVLTYNAFSDTTVEITSTSDYINSAYSSGVSALATSKSGANIYTVNSASEWSSYDGDTFSDQGKLDGNPLTTSVAVITDNNDNSYFYRFDFTIGFFTLSKYDNNQANIWAAAYSAGSTNVYLSADYQRVIHLDADNNQLVLDYMVD